MNDPGDMRSGEDSPLALRRADLELKSARAASAEPARPVVVVLGMHRSGTSLLSNVLHVLGVDMADTSDHVSPKNAGGFWERPELVDIHDEILAAIGRPIAQPSHVLPFPPAWWRSKEVQALKPKLVDYVRRELGKSSNPWGFKDPRTCRLLPLWWEVFRELNLEPVYVNALRAPSEASVSMSQKSKARKLSVGNSEMMWLSYNYDIARHVTVKSPAVTIGYEEWFADPNAVAQRLSSQLGIGQDLSSEDIAECMSSIVRSDYRHQVDGREGVSSNVPIATMLYEAMTAENPPSSGALRNLRGQLRLVDLFFKSLAPVAYDLDVLSEERSTLQSEKEELQAARDELAAQEAAVRQQLADEGAAAAGLAAAKDAEAERLNDAIGERDARIARLEQDGSALREQLGAVRDEFAVAKNLAAEAHAAAEKRSRDATALTIKLDSVESELARVESELGRTSGELARVESELGRTSGELARVESELGRTSGELARVESEMPRVMGELERAEAELQAARAELETAHSAFQTTQADLEAATARAQTLEANLQRSRHRALGLVRAARNWRGSYIAEHGEEAARLDSAERVAELQRTVSTLERRLAEAKERENRFIAELGARDASLEALATDRPGDRDRDDGDDTFQWPSDAPVQVEGAVTHVDGSGIRGHVLILDRPDIVPVIELRVDGSLVVAQSCLANDLDAPVAPDGSRHFSIPWSRVGQQFAGKVAQIVVAGIQHELGQAAIPADLHRYQVSPAVRVAETFGGTIAEAAEYQRWLITNAGRPDAELARSYRADRKRTWPRIIVAVHGPNFERLAETLQSLRGQIYAEWEALCIDAPKAAEDIDPRIRAIALDDSAEVLAGIDSDAPVTFVQAADTIEPSALLHLAYAAVQTRNFRLIYSDEDRADIRVGLQGGPHIKAAWSTDLALAQDFISRLALIRRGQLGDRLPANSAEVYAAALKAGLSDAGPAVHVPFVLYHRAVENADAATDLSPVVRSVLESTPGYEGTKVEKRGEGRLKIVWPLPDPQPKVSLIVPTRDRADLLRVCVDGFLHETRYRNLEVLIADNDSAEEETKAYLAKVATHPRVRVIPVPGPFNYSKINNLAVEQASGDLVGLMNNDLKVLDPDWLMEMVRLAVRPDVGAVGAKLLHGDGTIQHAGVTLGIGLASHLYKSAPGGAEGHQGRLVLPHDVSAVTAACLLMRRDVWDEVGGLDEEFPVAYNDVDLCLKVRAAGYRILWTPDAVVYHLESQSRGKDVTPEKRERLDNDKARLMERWGDALTTDPFHSPNFSASHVDSRLAFPPRVKAPWQSPATVQ